MKLHTLLDLRGNIPTVPHVSDGKLHDANILDQLIHEAGALHVMDRDYLDFERLARFDQASAFLTDHFDLPALSICKLYKMRWQVELFFKPKSVKQHLLIKAFFGTSENAVKSQIRIAVCAYVLVAIVPKRLLLEASMHEILHIPSLSLFEKHPLHELLTLAVPTLRTAILRQPTESAGLVIQGQQ
ncbi:MAG: transposase [Gammaproteobacteria bacterium]|nr:transposase [Gammaproteobacteria bacterium]